MSIEEVVRREPWRLGVGQPINALDPTWSIQRSLPCEGEVAFEPGSKWWCCQACGYCGTSTIHRHHPVQNPVTFFQERFQDYLAKRASEGVEPVAALEQALQIAGTALGYASAIKTEGLSEYLNKLVVR